MTIDALDTLRCEALVAVQKLRSAYELFWRECGFDPDMRGATDELFRDALLVVRANRAKKIRRAE